MVPSILGLGFTVPPRILDQVEAAELAADCCATTPRERNILAELYKRSGVATRRVVLTDEASQPPEARFFSPTRTGGRGPGTAERMGIYAREAPPLAMAASRAALGDADIGASAITHLITISCTGFFSPGIDAQLIRELGLPPTVSRTNIGFMGCHAAINGLAAAAAICGADAKARVLMCAVELCSLHFQHGWNPDRIVSNALFADGAGAVVVGIGEGIPLGQHRSAIIPDTTHAMGWAVGDHGFEMTLHPSVPDLIRGSLREVIAGFMVDESTRWIVHPGGPRILTAVEEALSLEVSRLATSREVLRSEGNMSSPTVLRILQRQRAAGGDEPAVMLAFGPGLAVEAMELG